MHYSVTTKSPASLQVDCLISGVYTGNKLTDSSKRLDEHAQGKIGHFLKKSNLQQPGDSLLLHELPGIRAEKLLLVCLGPKKAYKPADYRKACSAAFALLQTDNSSKLATTLINDLWRDGDTHASSRDAVLACEAGIHRVDGCKSDKVRKKANPRYPLEKLQFCCADKQAAQSVQSGCDQGRAIAAGMATAKDLANLPGNICTPAYLAEQALQLGKRHQRMTVSVLEERDMQKLGMGALLSVSRGSRQPAKLIVMSYQGHPETGAGRDKRPIVLVGKGLTFDAGGISLKPSAGMDEMKYDMCGGASVIGSLQACAELGLPLNLVGLVPAAENLPDGDANKPGDIVTSMSGQTIEILNTDAEGRLILCDTLTYAERFDPAMVVDIATLTGACVIALGAQATGLMSNDQPLADALLKAGQAINDRAWQLPLWEEYQQQLDSNFADMANIGGRPAGSITAGCFLSRFTESYPWAHLDIAGTAWKSGDDKGATGRPVPLLMQFLLDQCKA
jgi:leucyl aminopeptidase